MHIRNLIAQMHDEELTAIRRDHLHRAMIDGHALKPKGAKEADYATCPECGRGTVLVEHIWTPQLKLMPEEQHESVYYTCDWCNSEIEPEVNERMPRKPAGSQGEDELERTRRRA